jgi:hypothetical protein
MGFQPRIFEMIRDDLSCDVEADARRITNIFRNVTRSLEDTERVPYGLQDSLHTYPNVFTADGLVQAVPGIARNPAPNPWHDSLRKAWESALRK